MCITLPYWAPRWPELRSIIFCLRHPLAVARSIEKRYAVPISKGLDVWRTYTERFFDFADTADLPVYIFDFDEFQAAPVEVLSTLADWSGRDISRKEIVSVLEEFYSPGDVHWNIGESELFYLPDRIAALYMDIRRRAGAETQ